MHDNHLGVPSPKTWGPKTVCFRWFYDNLKERISSEGNALQTNVKQIFKSRKPPLVPSTYSQNSVNFGPQMAKTAVLMVRGTQGGHQIATALYVVVSIVLWTMLPETKSLHCISRWDTMSA